MSSLRLSSLASRALLPCLAALGLTACATAAAPPAGAPLTQTAAKAPAAPADTESHSAFGLFLAGQEALDDDSDRDATDYFIRAGHEDDEDLIHEKAFLAAVVAGDIGKAAMLAPGPGEGGAAMQKLSAMVRATEALAEGRGKDAEAAMAKEPTGFAYVGGYQLLKPWTAAAAGDTAKAIVLPDTQGQRLNRLAAVLTRSLIDERLKRYDEAEAGYKALTANAQIGAFYVLPYGAFLERRGRGKDAEALYRKFLTRAPDDKGLQQALARVLAKRPAPPEASLKEGASSALVSAAELALVQKSVDEGEVYLRLALRLDPQNDEAWLFLGDVRTAAGEYAEARLDYAKVPLTSESGLEARERVINTYQNAEDHDTALTLARDLVKSAPNDRDAQLALADALREKDQYEESAKVLTSLIDANPAEADWTLYFLRGTSLSEAGHWPEAEKDLLKALQLQPDEPDVLNYLGYSWVEKGEKLDQAMSMLQKAATAEPESGEIADSLGWAYYHLGDYHEAVLNLERAVTLNAVSPEINDHLGDAYWRVGRKSEAEFQWRRVLALQPSTELRASAERKLSSGLDGAIAPATQG